MIRQNVELRGDNPLDALVTGSHYKIGLADVHGAIAFYFDNEAAIRAAIQAACELDEQLGAHDGKSVLLEMCECKQTD